MFALGVFAGVFLTMSVQMNSMPLYRDNMVAGMAVRAAHDGSISPSDPAALPQRP